MAAAIAGRNYLDEAEDEKVVAWTSSRLVVRRTLSI